MTPKQRSSDNAQLWNRIMKKHKIEPNFWCSTEYLKLSGLTQKTEMGWVWIEDKDQWIFPPIHVSKGIGYQRSLYNFVPIWSDFEGFNCEDKVSEFLDYEFIYDPKNFLDLKGKKWTKFRKNIRKWPRRNGKPPYEKIDPCEQSLKSSIDDLLVSWLIHKGSNKFIHDSELLLNYVHNAKHRAILLHPKSGILGLNVWDHSWKYVNYRFMICRPEPFLDEYMRYLFYTSEEIQNSGKLINDGGCLDNAGLKKFKNTLNPVKIREVKSWKPKKIRKDDS